MTKKKGFHYFHLHFSHFEFFDDLFSKFSICLICEHLYFSLNIDTPEGTVLIDFSKNRLNEDVLKLLLNLV